MSDSISTLVSTENAVLELIVNNHPGVMMHVCSLFARRAFNMDGVVCVPEDQGERSRMWLRVSDDVSLEQVIKHLEKLEDVLTVRRHRASRDVFEQVEALLRNRR